MSNEQSQPEPLDYARRRPPGRLARGMIVSILGTAVALTGVAVFLGAHRLTRRDYVSLVADHARLHELLWAAFGIALLLSGALLAAVGLRSWCRDEGG